jgi:hypothetical protein
MTGKIIILTISEYAIKLALAGVQDPDILVFAFSHHRKGITPHSLLLLSTTLKNITSKRSSFKNRKTKWKTPLINSFPENKFL